MADLSPYEAITVARQGIYALGGIEIYKKDGVVKAQPMNASPEAKKRAEAYNVFAQAQEAMKAAPGDWPWDFQA